MACHLHEVNGMATGMAPCESLKVCVLSRTFFGLKHPNTVLAAILCFAPPCDILELRNDTFTTLGRLKLLNHGL